MKILVLASAGFIGRNLCNFLSKQENVEVVGAARTLKSSPFKTKFCNLTDFYSLQNTILDVRPDIIINCAGISSVSECENYPIKALETNYFLVANILKILTQFDMRKVKFVNLGTSYENSQSKSFYADTKKLSRQIIEIYRKEHNIIGNQVFLSNTVGPGQSENFVVAKIINYIKNFHKLQLKKLELGNLNSVIRPLFIEDACQEIFRAAQSREKNQNIEGKILVSIENFVKLVFLKVGIENWGNYVVLKPELFRADEPKFFPSKIKTEDWDYLSSLIDKMIS